MQFLDSADDFFNCYRVFAESRVLLFLKPPPREIISGSTSPKGANPQFMANINTKKGVIGILTGGGDVPGLNPAIRGVTLRAIREGYQVIGIRHGWAGLVDMIRDKDYDNSDNFFLLDEETVDRAGRTGGTFLHSSRTNPGRVSKSNVPSHLKEKFTAEKNDLTSEVLKNLAWLALILSSLSAAMTRSATVFVSTRKGSKSSAFPRPWTTMSPAPTTVSASALASLAPSKWSTASAPPPGPTSASWSSKSLAGTLVSPLCFPPWPAPPIAASFPNINSISSISPSCSSPTDAKTPAATRSSWSRKAPCSKAARWFSKVKLPTPMATKNLAASAKSSAKKLRKFPPNSTAAKRSTSSTKSWVISSAAAIPMLLIPSLPWPTAISLSISS